MKRTSVQFLIGSLLLLFLIINVIEAIDKEEARNENENEHGAENNVKENDGIDKDELKEALTRKKDENLGEEDRAKAKKKDEEGSLNGDSRVEECDPSNRCIDKKSRFVACLRVPGKGHIWHEKMIKGNYINPI